MVGQGLLLGHSWGATVSLDGVPLGSTSVSLSFIQPRSAVVYKRAGYLWAQLFCDFNLSQTTEC